MALTFYWYPNCSTCRKAKKWLEENDLAFEAVHMVEEKPRKAAILTLLNNASVEPKKYINTSSKVYREQNMKDKIKDASKEEMASYLAANGMLIKRPIVTDGHKVTVGFKEDDFQQNWK